MKVVLVLCALTAFALAELPLKEVLQGGVYAASFEEFKKTFSEFTVLFFWELGTGVNDAQRPHLLV